MLVRSWEKSVGWNESQMNTDTFDILAGKAGSINRMID